MTKHFGKPTPGTRWLEARIWAQLPVGITSDELRQQAVEIGQMADFLEKQFAGNEHLPFFLAAFDTYKTATASYATSLDAQPGSDAHVEREKAAYERAVELRDIRIECERKGMKG